VNKGKQQNLTASLDLSGSCVRAVIGSQGDNGLPKILGMSKIRCNGICFGEIVDASDTSRAVQLAIREAEVEAGVKAPPVRVGIYGEYISTRRIQPENKTAQSHRPGLNNKALLHMCEVEESGEVFVVTAHRRPVEEIVSCVAQSKVQVADLAWIPLNVGAVLLPQESADRDVLILDFGYDLTHAILVRKGRTHDVFSISTGGEDITNNLSVAFGLSFQDAENIKLRDGWAMAKLSEQYDPIRTPFSPLRPVQVIYSIQVARVIEDTMTTLLDEISNNLSHAGYDMFISQVYLTGGTSALRGLPELVMRQYGVPATRGLPGADRGGTDGGSLDSLSGVLGMLYGANDRHYRGFSLPHKQAPRWRRAWRSVSGLMRSAFTMEYRPAHTWEV